MTESRWDNINSSTTVYVFMYALILCMLIYVINGTFYDMDDDALTARFVYGMEYTALLPLGALGLILGIRLWITERRMIRMERRIQSLEDRGGEQ